MDWFDEKCKDVLEDDYFAEAQLMANSRQEALDLVGDDSFYPGTDDLEDDEDLYNLFDDELDEEDD